MSTEDVTQSRRPSRTPTRAMRVTITLPPDAVDASSVQRWLRERYPHLHGTCRDGVLTVDLPEMNHDKGAWSDRLLTLTQPLYVGLEIVCDCLEDLGAQPASVQALRVER